jgi:hypothetical protein
VIKTSKEGGSTHWVESWWLMPQTKCVAEAIKNVEQYLEKNYVKKLPKSVRGPLSPTIALSCIFPTS